MHLKYQVRKKKNNSKVPVAVWILNMAGWGGGRETNKRFRNVERLSMVSFTEPVSRVCCSSMIRFPHSVGQAESDTAEEGWGRGKQAGAKVSTLIASKLQPSQRRVFLELPSCHFKISTHLTQIGWVIIIFVKMSGLFWTKNTSNQIYLNIILH